jgi:hypothetical protein
MQLEVACHLHGTYRYLCVCVCVASQQQQETKWRHLLYLTTRDELMRSNRVFRVHVVSPCDTQDGKVSHKPALGRQDIGYELNVLFVLVGFWRARTCV